MPTEAPIPESFATSRLRADRLGEAHEQVLYRLHTDERVMATLAGVKSRGENRTWVRKNIQHWSDHGFGFYALFDPDHNFVGRAGLLNVQIEGNDEIELNYSIAADHWSRGYATECARHLLEIGFDSLSLTSIIAFTLTTNQASQRVMQKVGMTYQHDFIHSDQPHVLYRVSTTELQNLKCPKICA